MEHKKSADYALSQYSSISSILSSGQDHCDFDDMKSLLSVYWLAPVLDAVNDIYKQISWQQTLIGASGYSFLNSTFQLDPPHCQKSKASLYPSEANQTMQASFALVPCLKR
jgi:hypothetical protein